jgi:hypothetical protein
MDLCSVLRDLEQGGLVFVPVGFRTLPYWELPIYPQILFFHKDSSEHGIIYGHLYS